MRLVARILALVFVVPATFLFVYWVPFSLLPGIRVRWIPEVVSLACAVTAGVWVWRKIGLGRDTDQKASSSVLIGGCLLGAVGFVSGFLGPLFFHAGDQGPLLGIFFTGPVGFVLGLAIGAIVTYARLGATTARAVLAAGALAVGVASLLLSIPAERYQGDLVDATPVRCRPAADVAPEAVAVWDQRFREHTDWTVRPGWKENVPRMLAAEPGVVITLQVHRSRRIFELGKPWRRGKLRAGPWNTGQQSASEYFARVKGGTCDGFELGKRKMYAVRVGPAPSTPPDVLHSFLGCPLLEEVPAAYTPFTQN
jgi:hypothetical protein